MKLNPWSPYSVGEKGKWKKHDPKDTDLIANRYNDNATGKKSPRFKLKQDFGDRENILEMDQLMEKEKRCESKRV